MPRRIRLSCVVLLLAALLLSACAKKEAPPPVSAPSPSPAAVETAVPAEQAPPAETAPEVSETPAPTEQPEPNVPAFDDIRALITDGQYYEAFREMLAFEESTEDEAERAACEALFTELDQVLREIEPETGTELERGFTVQGGGVLEVYAFNGPALVTVTADGVEAQPELASNYVSFYVRQGERGETHVPAGTYRVRYQVGYRWFGEADGFGEYCTEGELPEPLYFDFYMDGQWANNAKFSITL